MPPDRSDRALRRAVADLAACPSEDIDAVLDALGPTHRAAVLQLMSGYSEDTTASESPVFEPPRSEHYSLWIAERLDVGDHRMTDHARAVLRDAAASFAPSPVVADVRRTSLVGSFGAMLSRRRQS